MGSLNSTLRFDDISDVDIEMNTVSLSGSCAINDNWTLRGGLGAILDGRLRPETGLSQNVTPGGLMAIGIEYLMTMGEGYTPYVDVSLFISGSTTEIEDPITKNRTRYTSSDLRLGARTSWNVKNRVFPYFSARVFGGPVNWVLDGKDVIGTDINHYQIAAGTAVQFNRVGTFIEWAGIGEKALSIGLSYAW